MQPCDDDDVEDSNVAAKLKEKGMTLQYRREARAFKRLFNSPDGKIVMDAIKRDINWDGSGSNYLQDDPIIRVEEWIGQRAVVTSIIEKISHGAMFTREETENTPTN